MGLSRPPIERLMEKVRILDNGCWEWTQHMDSKGYARLWVDRRNVGAHRFSYEYHVGPIPAGLQIDHLCHYPSCVNPDHLEPVTAAENARKYYERNRELTIERARIWRLENLDRAREIARETQRRQRAKKKAA